MDPGIERALERGRTETIPNPIYEVWEKDSGFDVIVGSSVSPSSVVFGHFLRRIDAEFVIRFLTKHGRPE